MALVRRVEQRIHQSPNEVRAAMKRASAKC